MVPLIDFADGVRSISATGLDLVGVGEIPMRPALKQSLQSFDSIVSWYGANRPEFREAMLHLNVPCEFYPALPPDDYAGHATDFFARQVGASDGLIPKIELKATCVRRNAIAIHPFSGSLRKNWKLDAFRQLAASLQYPCEWTAGPEEELPAPLQSARFDNLLELAKWLRTARLYIGNDSGITHLAAALGVTTIALFGETKPETWAPRGENVTVLRSTPLDDLTVATVRDAINRLLG